MLTQFNTAQRHEEMNFQRKIYSLFWWENTPINNLMPSYWITGHFLLHLNCYEIALLFLDGPRTKILSDRSKTAFIIKLNTSWKQKFMNYRTYLYTHMPLTFTD